VKPKSASVDFTVPGSFYPSGHHLIPGSRRKKITEIVKRLKAKKSAMKGRV